MVAFTNAQHKCCCIFGFMRIWVWIRLLKVLHHKQRYETVCGPLCQLRPNAYHCETWPAKEDCVRCSLVKWESGFSWFFTCKQTLTSVFFFRSGKNDWTKCFSMFVFIKLHMVPALRSEAHSGCAKCYKYCSNLNGTFNQMSWKYCICDQEKTQIANWVSSAM